MSAKVAPPRLMRKPACFSETCAPPTVSSFQTALVDERPGKVALRPLEGTARAGPFQGLAGLALGHQLPHGLPNLRRIAGRQGKLRPQHHRFRVFCQQAVPVSQFQFLTGKGSDTRFREQHGSRAQHLLHLAAVGPGVHANAAAHRAGDAVGKFQPGEAQLAGKDPPFEPA